MQTLSEPIVFHPLKHHLQYIRQFIRDAVVATETDIKAALQTVGSSQLDLYTGLLSPLQIAQETIAHLETLNLLTQEAYSTYLAFTETGYQTILLSDKTEWVLRWGLQVNRYVHIHPARYANNTIRVKAVALKIATAALIVAHKTDAQIDLALVNCVRKKWLNLSKIKNLTPNGGIERTILLLDSSS